MQQGPPVTNSFRKIQRMLIGVPPLKMHPPGPNNGAQPHDGALVVVPTVLPDETIWKEQSWNKESEKQRDKSLVDDSGKAAKKWS